MKVTFFFFFLFLALFTLHGPVLVESGDPDDFFNWVVSYSTINPLGATKKVIVINNQFPGPLLNTTTNDVVHINVHNNIDEPLLFTWDDYDIMIGDWYNTDYKVMRAFLDGGKTVLPSPDGVLINGMPSKKLNFNF